MLQNGVNKAFLSRIPIYLNYLYLLDATSVKNISATTISKALGLGEVQVRKDLSLVAKTGRPKVGYDTKELIQILESFLGYDEVTNVIIVGCGKLGCALLHYPGFKDKGINIIAGFDQDETKIGDNNGKPILGMDKLDEYCRMENINVAIIAVPALNAQDVVDKLVYANVKKIWNFAPTRLIVPEDILVQNQDLASEIALFAKNI